MNNLTCEVEYDMPLLILSMSLLLLLLLAVTTDFVLMNCFNAKEEEKSEKKEVGGRLEGEIERETRER